MARLEEDEEEFIVETSDDEDYNYLFGPEPEATAANNVYVVLTDREVFDCPICLDQLFTPVFQLHKFDKFLFMALAVRERPLACSSCCSKLKRKCPFCCRRIDIRCRGLEKFIQSINMLCKYADIGCTETMPYSKKIEHEQVCQDVKCFCPYPLCPFTYIHRFLYRHFDVRHALSTTRFTYNTTFSVSVELNQKQIFLQERHESVVFILHQEVQQHERAFYVDCVGVSTLKDMFAYHSTAESMDMDTCVTMKLVPEILSLSVCIVKDDLGLYDRDAHKYLKVLLNDPCALDCSICLEPLWTPVFQCENAHLACSSCCSKLKSKCSCCGYSYSRCRGLEKVTESIGKISCKYAKYGCKETHPYNKKSKHEKYYVHFPVLTRIRAFTLGSNTQLTSPDSPTKLLGQIGSNPTQWVIIPAVKYGCYRKAVT
ncbi:aminotransferase-like mobile domain-containing protein [Tanacetum coccineum]|uniref:RING-type E3 ubiquitin transferase n=1 Tax=Tanacetum coccineum TaxID=301880 RepID=A0ABQ4WWE4_9ASTR